MKAVVYIRVSREEQHTENQMPSIEAFAKSRGWQIVEVYSENETAWKSGHQHELKRLLDNLRSGRRKYDILLVWALDRLSRQGSEAILSLVSAFKTYGCRVISIQEPWTELPGELGEVLYAIAGWVARMESQRRSERTKAGVARAKANGKLRTRGRDKGKRRRAGYLARYQTKVRKPTGTKEKAEIYEGNGFEV